MWHPKRMIHQGTFLVIVLTILWGCATEPRPEPAVQAKAPRAPCEPLLAGHPRHGADAGRATLEARLEDRQLSPSLQGDTSATGSPTWGKGRLQVAPDGTYQIIGAFGPKHFSYLVHLKRHIEQAFFVPQFQLDHGPVGTPIVGLSVHRNGTLSEVVLLRSSGYPVLDCALVEAVQRAAPYAPFPDHLPEQALSIRVYATRQ